MEKTYEIVRATERPLPEIKVDDHRLSFAKNGQLFCNDPGLAREIDQRYGRKGQARPGDVVVMEVDKPREQGHRCSFTVPELPWKRRS